MLTIHQLEVFVTVADAGSVRRAAEVLVVTQPAVSASLSSLEKTLGVELFRRAGRGIELTDAGRTMERYARMLLNLVDEAITSTRSALRTDAAPVRVGATTAAADHMLVPQMARVRAARPATQWSLEIGNRTRIWQLLADRVVDIAITTHPPTSGAFVSLATKPNAFVLVGRPGLVWPGGLGDVTWLLREDGSGTRAVTDELLARLGLSPPSMVIGSNATILHSTEAGLGVALLPLDAVSEAIKVRRLALIRTPGTPAQRPWHLLVRPGETLTLTARQFVADLAALDSAETGWELTPAGALELAT